MADETPASFTLTLDVTGPAFQPTPYPEVSRLLRAIADRIASIDPVTRDFTDEHGGWSNHFQTVHDIDGRDVGRFAFKPASYLRGPR